MSLQEQYYEGGAASALTAFGLTKVAVSGLPPLPPRKTGLERVIGAGGPSAGLGQHPGQVPGAPPAVGGPGMDPRFAGRGIPLETAPVAAEKNLAMRGMSLFGKQLPAARGPVPLHPGMNVVGHLLLPWPE